MNLPQILGALYVLLGMVLCGLMLAVADKDDHMELHQFFIAVFAWPVIVTATIGKQIIEKSQSSSTKKTP